MFAGQTVGLEGEARSETRALPWWHPARVPIPLGSHVAVFNKLVYLELGSDPRDLSAFCSCPGVFM